MDITSQQFYNLNADPFRLFPDHHFSFFHRTYKNGIDDLKLGLDAGNGFIVITGRPGTGKTTLINQTIAQLDTNKVVVANLVTTQYEAHDLLGMIASSFSLNCYKKSKSIILLELEKFLWMKRSKGKRVLLVVDEAQGLEADALEELQALSNLQDNGKPLLQIILIGREELSDIISSPKLENLRKRIISSSRLEPLTESETIDYITHRLDHAGWIGDPEITKGTACLAYHFSGGIPSLINLIFNRLLHHGYVSEKHDLNAEDMKSVLEDLSEERLVTEKYVLPSDIEEKVYILENEHIQPLNRIKKTYEPEEYPGVSNNPESTIQTDESTDKASAETGSYEDTRNSNNESQADIEATAFDSPTSQAPDARKRSRWRRNYAWLIVPAAIAIAIAIEIAIGLKIFSGAPQDSVKTGNNHDTKEKHIDRLNTAPERVNEAVQSSHDVANMHLMNPSAGKPDTGNKAGKTSTVKAVKAETYSSTDPAPQSLKVTTAPDMAAEPVEPTQVAASGESVLAGVKRTNETLTQAKAAPVILKPEKSSIPVEKELQKARVTSNVTEAADSDSLTMDTLLATQWITDTGQQAAHLPSFITDCSARPGSVECRSREYFIENNGKSVRAKTRTYLKDFTESGFTIRYKHMLLGGANDKWRWEDKTHQLGCMIIDRDKIKCNEGGDNGAVIFTQNTSDQLISQFTHTLLTSVKWMENNQPATFLPSYINSCQPEDGRLSCWSQSRKHKSSRNMETIKTKAVIGQIIDGDFTVTYRNLVMSAMRPSAWENNTHEARCSIHDFNKIVCKESDNMMTYTKDIQKF